MYCLLELLTVVGVVVALATILFVVSAAAIVIDEGMRWVIERPARAIRHALSFSTAIPKSWKATISGQLGSLHPKADKL